MGMLTEGKQRSTLGLGWTAACDDPNIQPAVPLLRGLSGVFVVTGDFKPRK